MTESSAATDLDAHKNTYASFIKLAKYSIVALVVVMVFLYFAISP
jgi:Bacterial aa3 type cytochrome c oxidase subunit IV